MLLLQIAVILIAILLIVNIFSALKAGKKEENTNFTEIKNSVGSLISNLKVDVKDDLTENN